MIGLQQVAGYFLVIAQVIAVIVTRPVTRPE